MTQTYKKSLEENATNEAISNVTLEDIIQDQKAAANYEFDKELSEETLDDIFIDEEENEYF